MFLHDVHTPITCNYLTRWPCQVKECKIILERSLLTGWLAGCVVNLVSNFPFPVGHNPGARLGLLSRQAVQKVYTHRIQN